MSAPPHRILTVTLQLVTRGAVIGVLATACLPRSRFFPRTTPTGLVELETPQVEDSVEVQAGAVTVEVGAAVASARTGAEVRIAVIEHSPRYLWNRSQRHPRVACLVSASLCPEPWSLLPPASPSETKVQ